MLSSTRVGYIDSIIFHKGKIMRVLSEQEIQSVCGSASTAAPKATGTGLTFGELVSVFFVGLYLLVTGKSLLSLY